MKQKINIAIDGYSSCGKSTLTKQLAQTLNYQYIDTGAMYRAVTLYFIENEVNLQDVQGIQSALENITISFSSNTNQQVTLLNGVDVEQEIRTMRVSGLVSEVASIPQVRHFLVKQQQQIATSKGFIMDGRDIGTVVLPNADLKLFMTADQEVRVERRYNELLQKGKEITRDEVRKNLQHRDHVDTHRKESPLVKAEDAVLLDNSNMTREQQFNFVLARVEERIVSLENSH